ncbi:MAG: molybdenum cofactor biosynthesis protein MoaE [Saprospiraceae bacterium]|nr:molybdenum cofactor biosynthesis protein MoaE [Saprospiraceae bacterium]
MENIDIQIQDTPLSINSCYDFVATDDCGGIDLFVGTVRNSTRGKEVMSLSFEAYIPMAESEMNKIAKEIIKKWQARRVSIHHRIGDLGIGEIAVIIAVSAPHREATFAACKYAIDTLKETVPIWKKEIFHDGEVWVAAHP